MPPVRAVKPVEIPVSPTRDAPPPLDDVDRPPSALGLLLERGASEHQLLRMCLRPGSLGDISPREAQRAIERFASGHTDEKRERAIVNVLASLTPNDRGECLRLLDGGGDRHTVRRLLQKDIDAPVLRQEAARLIGEAAAPAAGHVVISDIDDTIKPRKGFSRDPNVFPGAREVFAALDAGPDGKDARGDIHFVTARDGFFMSGAPAVRAAGIDANSIRHGDVLSAIASPFDDNKALADRKVKNITGLLERNPSRTAILVGDSVQADPDVFRRVMDKCKNVDVALVHEIRGFPAPSFTRDDPRFIVFRDYGEAARKLAERGLISPAQRDRILASL